MFDRSRADAWVLTKDAQAAARASDCETVRKLGGQVLALDTEFHGTVFLSDVGIARCLAPAPLPVAPVDP